MLKNLSFGLSFVVKNVREHGAMKQMYCLNHLTDKCWLLSSALLTTLAVAVSGRERLCIPWGWGKHSFDWPNWTGYVFRGVWVLKSSTISLFSVLNVEYPLDQTTEKSVKVRDERSTFVVPTIFSPKSTSMMLVWKIDLFSLFASFSQFSTRNIL